MTALDIITDALMEIGALAQGETASAGDAAFGLRKLNRMFDRWAAREIMAYNVTFSQFNLVANLNPHTIGPTGTFTVAQRPVKIESAKFQVSTGSDTPVFTPIAIRDDDWWALNPIPALSSSVVTNLYYSPDWPNGKLNFWPVPSVNNPVILELWGLLGNFPLLTTAFSYPPGYWDTVINNLAVELAPAFQAPISPQLEENARKGLAAIESNNAESPRMETRQAGMPSDGRGQAPDFNFLTGAPW